MKPQQPKLPAGAKAKRLTPLAPVFMRLPRPGETDPYFGAKRGFWFELILPSEKNRFTPAVKSKLIKKPGAKRGVRFIDFSSAKAWFEAQDSGSPSDDRMPASLAV